MDECFAQLYDEQLYYEKNVCAKIKRQNKFSPGKENEIFVCKSWQLLRFSYAFVCFCVRLCVFMCMYVCIYVCMYV